MACTYTCTATNDFGMDTASVDVERAGTQLYKQMLMFQTERITV